MPDNNDDNIHDPSLPLSCVYVIFTGMIAQLRSWTGQGSLGITITAEPCSLSLSTAYFCHDKDPLPSLPLQTHFLIPCGWTPPARCLVPVGLESGFVVTKMCVSVAYTCSLYMYTLTPHSGNGY